jgi:hypothetical protein
VNYTTCNISEPYEHPFWEKSNPREREREREEKKKPTMDASITTKATPVVATEGRKKQAAMSGIQTGNSMEEEDDKDAKSENSR